MWSADRYVSFIYSYFNSSLLLYQAVIKGIQEKIGRASAITKISWPALSSNFNLATQKLVPPQWVLTASIQNHLPYILSNSAFLASWQISQFLITSSFPDMIPPPALVSSHLWLYFLDSLPYFLFWESKADFICFG